MKIYNQQNWSESQQMLMSAEVPEEVGKLTPSQLIPYLSKKYQKAAQDAKEWKNPAQYVAEMLEIPEPNPDPKSIAEAILSSNQFLTRLWEKDKPSDQNQTSQKEMKDLLNPGLEALVRLLKETEVNQQ